MDLVERLRAWSYQRQRLGDPAATPREALRSVVGVYSAHPTAPLALAARTRRMTADDFRALDRKKQALRIPAMRLSIFLVPKSSTAKIFTALRPPLDFILNRLTHDEALIRDYEKIAKRILAAAPEPRTAQELQEPADVGKNLSLMLRSLRYEGRLLAVGAEGLRSDALRYVATSKWVPRDLDGGDEEKALAWLAGEYLQAFGPTRVADFAWWTGVKRPAAATAFEAHKTVEVYDGLLLPAAQQKAFEAVKRPKGKVDLLPKWDSYTMGLAPDGRQRFVHPDVQKKAYTPAGDGNPVVLVDGQVAGTWNLTVKDGASVDLFDSLGPSARRRLDKRLEEVAALLG
jgi:hypothetical protein